MAYYSYKRVRDILIDSGEIIFDEDNNLRPKNSEEYGERIDNTYLGNLYEMIADHCEKLQAENAELKKQSQWISVEDEPSTPHEHTEWDETCDNCIFDGWVSDSFELSDGSPYNLARGHYQDNGKWVVYGAEHDFQIIKPEEVKFYKPLPKPPEGE